LVIAAACSFFFALAESALFALGRFRARRLLEDNPEHGRKLAPLFNDPEDLVAMLAFGNTTANALLIGFVVWILSRTYQNEIAVGATALVLLLLLCEVVPKALGVRAPEFWSVRVATSVHLFLKLTRPFRRVAQAMNGLILRITIPKSIKPQPAISEEEYQDLLNIAQQQGALGKTEKDMILQILALDQRTAGDVMNPRTQISFISDELSKEEMLREAHRIKHTRIPIFDETPDTIVGVLNARAFLLNPEADLEEVIEFPSFVPESMNLLQLLRSLQRQQRGVAIVLDEFGGTAGLVTMQDILEDTLGRNGRRDGKPVLEKLSAGRWRVSGTCPIDEFRREYPGLPETDEVDTMSGLMVRKMEYVPGNGEMILLDGLKLTATKVNERRVLELEVEATKK
jgi:CBS domain containing-hemolysin-like protein